MGASRSMHGLDFGTAKPLLAYLGGAGSAGSPGCFLSHSIPRLTAKCRKRSQPIIRRRLQSAQDTVIQQLSVYPVSLCFTLATIAVITVCAQLLIEMRHRCMFIIDCWRAFGGKDLPDPEESLPSLEYHYPICSPALLLLSLCLLITLMPTFKRRGIDLKIVPP